MVHGNLHRRYQSAGKIRMVFIVAVAIPEEVD